MVLGILAYVTWLFGIIFAILALVFGYQAKRRIRESGGWLGGAGMAKAGRILGWIYVALIPLIVILAAVVFVLVADLEAPADGVIDEDAAVIPAGDSWLVGFVIYSTGVTAHHEFDAGGTDNVLAGFFAVDDANDPNPTSLTGWAEVEGAQGTGSAPLARGSYAYMLTCDNAVDPCTVDYKVWITRS